MSNYSTEIHGPAATAPNVTGKFAVCVVCETEWQIQSAVNTDAEACPFCNAGKEAVIVHDESETSG